MLHLFPLRLILQLFAFLVGVFVLVWLQFGTASPADMAREGLRVFGWSSAFALALIFIIFAAWRWVPWVQSSVFPYLGGRWEGVLEFYGARGVEQRNITLTVIHTPVKLKLLLNSDESTSSTLVVHADRDRDFGSCRMYYVYLNERKPGLPGAGRPYRGMAVLHVASEKQTELRGNYFTEQQRHGTLRLTIAEKNKWWKLWR